VSERWDPELYEARHAFVWQLGQGVFELLEAKSDERILDLGCGTGQLTSQIAESGATVVGIDASPEMIGQARQNYPKLQFVLQDATRMHFREEFDAVFSNATLHWVTDAAGAVDRIAAALRPGGRFVAEFGGHGNIQRIEGAVRRIVGRDMPRVPETRWYYPTIGEYAAVLESAGLEVRFAQLFDRPTPLEGEEGMENWIRQFAWFYFEDLGKQIRAKTLRKTIDELRPALYHDGRWYADYRRLRVVAVKPNTASSVR
jgi:trans-aconitate methyltransferase